MINKCSAYIASGDFCRNGFIQKHPVCIGIATECPCCSRPYSSVAPCMRDEVRADLVDDAGRMRFAQAATHTKGEVG